jgi:hypothetical protein
MQRLNRSPAEPCRARGAKADFGNLSVTDDTDLRALAQRRLALKIAAGAGLGLALAAVVVVTALGDGGGK